MNSSKSLTLDKLLMVEHTGFPKTANATDNKRSLNQQAGIGCKYLSGNNLPQVKLACDCLMILVAFADPCRVGGHGCVEWSAIIAPYFQII